MTIVTFRHEELQKYQEKTEIEERAEKSGFSLVELDGDIAVVGNGAGLVMSTLDMLSDNGGKASMFLGCWWWCNHRISV